MRQRIGLGLMVVNNIGGGFKHTSAGVADRHARFKRMVAEPAYELFYKEGHVVMLSRTVRRIKTNRSDLRISENPPTAPRPL